MVQLSVLWKAMGLGMGVLPLAGAMCYHPANEGKIGEDRCLCIFEVMSLIQG